MSQWKFTGCFLTSQVYCRAKFLHYTRGIFSLSINKLLADICRQLFCWTDRWHGMTMEDIRALEEKTKEELDRQRKVGEVRGMKAED